MTDAERAERMEKRIEEIKSHWPTRLRGEWVKINPYSCTLDGNFTHNDLALIAGAMLTIRKEFPEV